jgi:hypothetical protein
MASDELSLFIHWEKTLGDLLDRTAKFPKAVRFTFTTRIDNLALDIIESLTEARYARPGRKGALLKDIDLSMARLRVLLRLCNQRGYLDHRGFEHVMRYLDEAGRMIGGWRKHEAKT